MADTSRLETAPLWNSWSSTDSRWKSSRSRSGSGSTSTSRGSGRLYGEDGIGGSAGDFARRDFLGMGTPFRGVGEVG
jgi:hypothetical protein